MNENEGLTISELADAAGVTVRTIRYYVNEGLLPQADTQGRYALYYAAYLERLELIRRWKDAYLPLKEIRERIVPLNETQVREMLAQLDAVEAEIQPETPPEIHAMQAAPQPKVPSKIIKEESAIDYIHSLRGSEKSDKTSEPAADQQALDYIHDIRKRQNITPPSRKRAWGTMPSGQEWRRIQIFPGFEIHVSEAVYRQFEQELQELFDWISQKFKNHRV